MSLRVIITVSGRSEFPPGKAARSRVMLEAVGRHSTTLGIVWLGGWHFWRPLLGMLLDLGVKEM